MEPGRRGHRLHRRPPEKHRAINIGNTGITASTKVTAASLANTSAGSIVLQGNTASGTTDQATLDITATNSAVVAGSIRVLGDADLELADGITTVASTGFLQIDGAEARISLGAGETSTGVSGLAYNAGTVNFDGNCSLGYGGTTVTTTTDFTNANTLIVDYYGGDGGTSVTFGGTFTNMGSATIGNTDLGGNGSGGSTTVTASGLVNTRTATLILQGNTANATTHQATLDITGASSADVSGTLRVLGDADLELTTGITSVDTTGFLQIDGAQARISLGAGRRAPASAGLPTTAGPSTSTAIARSATAERRSRRRSSSPTRSARRCGSTTTAATAEPRSPSAERSTTPGQP